MLTISFLFLFLSDEFCDSKDWLLSCNANSLCIYNDKGDTILKLKITVFIFKYPLINMACDTISNENHSKLINMVQKHAIRYQTKIIPS